MAWFKKERKPRISQRTKLEIPKDAWERCESCGHVDIRERFERALNVLLRMRAPPTVTAEEYIELFTTRELGGSSSPAALQDPPHLRESRTGLSRPRKRPGSDAILHRVRTAGGAPNPMGVMISPSWAVDGSVGGERRSPGWPPVGRQEAPWCRSGTSGGARSRKGCSPDADGQDLAASPRSEDSIPGDRADHPTTGGVSASLRCRATPSWPSRERCGICGPRVSIDHRAGSPKDSRPPSSPRSWPDRRRGAPRLAPGTPRA